MRPTIYIGLGGTGIRAIAQTKKMYEDAYGVGKIPPQVAFIAVDFDLAAPSDRSLATNIAPDFLSLNILANPQQFYVEGVKQSDYKWVFKGNGRFIGKQIAEGASQVRTTGRFYTEMVLDKIRQRIKYAWQQVNSVAKVTQKVDKTAAVDIHIVMSLAGGTGCGSFINVAEMIRNTWPTQAHIIGYGVLHGVFCTMDPSRNKTPRVVANAYSAVMDLDYLMSASTDNPITCTINGNEQQLISPIYDEFFVIDNNTEHGHVLTDIKQVCEVLGISLFASGDDMGSKVRSVLNNKSWTNGEFNISPKVGWVQSLGACKIVYKGEQLATIYGYKAAMELIRSIRQEGAEAQQLAQKWTEEARVREDGDQYNMLIDSIVEPKTIEGLKPAMVDAKSTEAENKSLITSYMNNMADIPADARVKEMMEEKKKSLIAKIKSLLSAPNGVGNSRTFLESLIRLCEKYRLEMINEAEQFNTTLEGKNTLLAKATKEYEEYCGKARLFQAAATRQDYLEKMAKIAKDIRKINYEIKRREIARDIFIYLVKEAGELSRKIDTLDELLKTLNTEYSLALTELQNTNASSLVFEHDLSANERLNMTLKDDVSLASLLISLPASLLDLDVEKQLRPALEQYVSTLPQVIAYRERKITDVIEELSKEDYEELKFQINVKSSRLLRIDDRGLIERTKKKMPSEMMVQNYFLSVYDPENAGEGNEESRPKTRLELDDEFAKSDNLKKEFLVTDLAMLRQQMIIFRADCAVLPYCIDVFDPWTIKDEYEPLILEASQAGSTVFNPHFDQQIYDNMKLTDFKLKPEILNEAMFYWVCGHLFGWVDVTEKAYAMEKDDLSKASTKISGKEVVTHPKYIRCDKKVYQVWREDRNGENGQKWYPIGGISTDNRQRAFNNFKGVDFPQIRTLLHDKLVSDIQSRGEAYYEALIQTVIAGGFDDYIDRVMCADKSSSTYKSQRKQELDQINDEWNYIQKNLLNTLKNLK